MRVEREYLLEMLLGYAFQFLSIFVLILQNLVLPNIIGMEKFGVLAYVMASSYILFSFYDNGYNLLVIRKKDTGTQFIRAKMEIFFFASILYFFVYVVVRVKGGQGNILSPFLVLPHAFLLIWISYLVHVLLAAQRMRDAALLSVFFAGFNFLLPLMAVWLRLPLIYAPLVAALCAIVTAQLAFNDLSVLTYLRRSFGGLRGGIRYRRGLFLKQMQISIGTIVDSLIVWGGVYSITQLLGYHEAAVFRVAMSVIALMTITIPVFKPTFMRLSRHARGFNRVITAALFVVLFVGLVQWGIVWLAGEWLLGLLFPQSSTDLYEVLLVLAPVAALKVILELQTVLLDSHNSLPTMFATIPGAAAITSIVMVALGPSFLLIVLFYMVLGLFNQFALLRRRSLGAHTRLVRDEADFRG